MAMNAYHVRGNRRLSTVEDGFEDAAITALQHKLLTPFSVMRMFDGKTLWVIGLCSECGTLVWLDDCWRIGMDGRFADHADCDSPDGFAFCEMMSDNQEGSAAV